MSNTVEAQPQANADILLESGTNEFEVLVFGLGKGAYGVNVAKVREVILPRRITASPGRHESVRGIFNLRNNVLPLIDLCHYLNIEPVSDDKAKRIIVTEFNGIHTAFEVDWVEQIYRMSWKHMQPVPESYGQSHFCLTGITEIKERLVLMLDFESVVDHVNMQDDLHVEIVENTLGVDRAGKCVFIAEDSRFIRDLMETTLRSSGYGKIRPFDTGLQAWQEMERIAHDDSDDKQCDILIADIEMPQMDGLHLIRRVKADPALKGIPAILFSSLISDDTTHKGQQVGADDQLAKPQLPRLVEIVDSWIKRMDEADEAPAEANVNIGLAPDADADAQAAIVAAVAD